MQVNITVRSESDIPDFIRRLKEAKFYGQVHFTFRAGNISRLITEQSQIFDEGRNPNERNSR